MIGAARWVKTDRSVLSRKGRALVWFGAFWANRTGVLMAMVAAEALGMTKPVYRPEVRP